MPEKITDKKRIRARLSCKGPCGVPEIVRPRSESPVPTRRVLPAGSERLYAQTAPTNRPPPFSGPKPATLLRPHPGQQSVRPWRLRGGSHQLADRSRTFKTEYFTQAHPGKGQKGRTAKANLECTVLDLPLLTSHRPTRARSSSVVNRSRGISRKGYALGRRNASMSTRMQMISIRKELPQKGLGSEMLQGSA